MRRPAAAAVAAVLICLGTAGAISAAAFAAAGQQAGGRSVTIANDDGELARVPLDGDTFAVSYRNSIYGTIAEERYVVQPDGSFRLHELAADQLAVLEEYYAVPGSPAAAVAATDRRDFVAAPDPGVPVRFDTLSIAATDLGQRTLHAPGAPPLALWQLVGDEDPFVVLDIQETP